MKICLVGPGYMPIPPTGWGACEILIWNYYEVLTSKGHDVKIVNTTNPNLMVSEINQFNPDIVHIQYDDYYNLSNVIGFKTILTSHYAYLEQPNKHGGYSNIFSGFVRSNSHIFALSNGIKDTYVKYGRNPNTISVIPNGVRCDLFNFSETCENKSIYLAKVDYRKRQYLFHNIDDLYFAGNIADNRYNRHNYLGEWNKDYLHQNLTNFANLVLLSDGEAHPLVCLEGMAAGLGLVISEFATANLDTTLDWIDVIPESRINDIDYISNVIKENRDKSIRNRHKIREYVTNNFSYDKIVDLYLDEIKKII
jgi:glycosyltransferase involved in cell wall biosynthesis